MRKKNIVYISCAVVLCVAFGILRFHMINTVTDEKAPIKEIVLSVEEQGSYVTITDPDVIQNITDLFHDTVFSLLEDSMTDSSNYDGYQSLKVLFRSMDKCYEVYFVSGYSFSCRYDGKIYTTENGKQFFNGDYEEKSVNMGLL